MHLVSSAHVSARPACGEDRDCAALGGVVVGAATDGCLPRAEQRSACRLGARVSTETTSDRRLARATASHGRDDVASPLPHGSDCGPAGPPPPRCPRCLATASQRLITALGRPFTPRHPGGCLPRAEPEPARSRSNPESEFTQPALAPTAAPKLPEAARRQLGQPLDRPGSRPATGSTARQTSWRVLDSRRCRPSRP